MKKLLICILSFIFLFSISACSLLNDNVSQGTQQEGSLLDGAADGQDTAAGEPDTANTDEETAAIEGDGIETSSSANSKTIGVTLYFPTDDNSALKKEEREIPVVDGAILKACILALTEGPQTQGLRNPIPEGTVIRGISIKDKTAVVDLSEEFLHTSGLDEVTARLSIVNTLTQIDGVEKVRLHIEGEEMIGPSGMPLGDMEPASLNGDGTPAAGEMRTVTLYFSDSQAIYVAPEKRDIALNENDSIEEAVLRELIKGPKSDELWGAVPEGTKLISAKTKNGLCTVDLSGEFVENSPGGTASERMAIYSVVNTLTELEGVQKVQFLIEGKKREIYTHAIFDEPFSRDPELIAK